MSEVRIERRFRGPAQSGNGGYTCGLLAAQIEGPAEVTLRVPPPLERKLERRPDGEGGAELLDGEAVVASARPVRLAGSVRGPVTVDEAERASQRYTWADRHPYPGCFVCGPERRPGDGLRIFPGPVDGRELHACTWRPAADLGDAEGNVRPEFVWAALDCPTGIVTERFADLGTVILGRLAAEQSGTVPTGQTYVLTAWTEGREGRKLDTGSALFTAGGELLAHARARWIELRED